MAGTTESGEASLRSENVSAPQVATCLKGMNFPADKNAILSHIRTVECPEKVIDYINRLPDKEYGRVTDVEHEFGKMK